MFPRKTIVSALMAFSLVSCTGDDGGSSDATTKTGDPDDAMTAGISFSGGSVVSGTPPAATNNPGDITLTSPTDPASVSPGGSGTMSITINQPPGTIASMDVNVRFGNAGSFINIPVNSSITSQLAGTTGGVLDIPFTLSSSVCNNIADIQHQIQCYESVDIGGGVNVSPATARQMLLACGTASDGGDFATGPGDYCADDYPIEACTELNNTAGINSSFTSGQACSSAFPSSTVLGDYDCTTSGVFTNCGACAVDVNSKPVASSTGADPVYTVEEAMYEAFSEYQTNPDAQSKITFTPFESE